MKNVKDILAWTALAAVVILTMALVFNKCGTKQLQTTIDQRDGKIAILNEQVAMKDLQIAAGDSVWKRQKDSLTKMRADFAEVVKANHQISDAYAKIKTTVAKQSASEAMDYFKERTNTNFPTIITRSVPDSNFEVPVFAIKNANNKFIDLDEQYAITDNIMQQKDNLDAQVGNLTLQVHNRQSQVDTLQTQSGIKSRQIELLTQNVTAYQKQIKKADRKSTIWKITTTASIIAIAVLLLR